MSMMAPPSTIETEEEEVASLPKKVSEVRFSKEFSVADIDKKTASDGLIPRYSLDKSLLADALSLFLCLSRRRSSLRRNKERGLLSMTTFPRLSLFLSEATHGREDVETRLFQTGSNDAQRGQEEGLALHRAEEESCIKYNPESSSSLFERDQGHG